jgi:transcriptional regulator with XRE-family HTH domain
MFVNSIKIKDVKSEIGLLVKSFRKLENISQQELADKLGLSRITIQNLESGKNFTIDTLLKVAQHFDLLATLNDLLVEKRKANDNLKSLY